MCFNNVCSSRLLPLQPSPSCPVTAAFSCHQHYVVSSTFEPRKISTCVIHFYYIGSVADTCARRRALSTGPSYDGRRTPVESWSMSVVEAGSRAAYAPNTGSFVVQSTTTPNYDSKLALCTRLVLLVLRQS